MALLALVFLVLASVSTTEALSLLPHVTSGVMHDGEDAKKLGPYTSRDRDGSISSSRHRRELLIRLPLHISSAWAGCTTLTSFPCLATAATQNDLVLRLETPQDKAGLVLQDVRIGNPPRTAVAIQQVLPVKKRRNLSGTVKLQPGLVLLPSNDNDTSAKALVERIQTGPYPIELRFINLDASNGELGEALTAQDALQMSQRQTAMDSSNSRGGDALGTVSTKEAATIQSDDSNRYVIRTLRSSSETDSYCRKNRSQRDDVLEIIYEARIGSSDGIIYDASEFRGTGRPYQMVLGSGDMLPGVDQGLYDMCVGDVRQINIPAALAYGPRGNKLFRIPPNTNLVWQVELVSVDSMRRFNPNSSDDDNE